MKKIHQKFPIFYDCFLTLMQETLIVSAFCETSQGQNFEDNNQLEEIELKNQMRIAVMEVRQQIVNMV